MACSPAAWAALWRRAAGRDRYSDVRRQHEEANHADAGFRHNLAGLHALLFIADCREAEADGVNLKALKLRTGYFGAEPWTEAMRKQIEARLPLKAIDIYGSARSLARCGQRMP
jgi:hypothetical protein